MKAELMNKELQERAAKCEGLELTKWTLKGIKNKFREIPNPLTDYDDWNNVMRLYRKFLKRTAGNDMCFATVAMVKNAMAFGTVESVDPSTIVMAIVEGFDRLKYVEGLE